MAALIEIFSSHWFLQSNEGEGWDVNASLHQTVEIGSELVLLQQMRTLPGNKNGTGKPAPFMRRITALLCFKS